MVIIGTLICRSRSKARRKLRKKHTELCGNIKSAEWENTIKRYI